MESPFPPLPPEYVRLMAARWLCVGWNLLGLIWLVRRVRRRKDVRASDAFWWYGTAVVGLILIGFGYSQRSWIGNEWLEPLAAATVSLAIAGTTLSLIKLYEEYHWGGIVGIVLLYGLSLAWLLTPTGHYGGSSRWAQCRNNLKQIGLALHNYHDDHRMFPAAASGQPAHSWRVAILPFLDQQEAFDSYDRGLAWDVAPNAKLSRQEVPPFVCPAAAYPQDNQSRWYSAYSMPTGPRTVGESSTGTKIQSMTDGTSNTLLVVEACGAQIVWTEPRDVDVAAQPTGINLKGAKPQQSAGWLSSYHAHGTQVLMGDGSVKFLSQRTDPAILKKLATKDGGEEVGDF